MEYIQVNVTIHIQHIATVVNRYMTKICFYPHISHRTSHKMLMNKECFLFVTNASSAALPLFLFLWESQLVIGGWHLYATHFYWPFSLMEFRIDTKICRVCISRYVYSHAIWSNELSFYQFWREDKFQAKGKNVSIKSPPSLLFFPLLRLSRRERMKIKLFNYSDDSPRMLETTKRKYYLKNETASLSTKTRLCIHSATIKALFVPL